MIEKLFHFIEIVELLINKLMNRNINKPVRAKHWER